MYTDEYMVQIIDFDIAVLLAGVDEKIGDCSGSRDLVAPEIKDEDGPCRPYNPVLADRLSCGRLLAVFAERHGRRDGGLSEIAIWLMNEDPLQRPSICRT